MRNNNIAKKKNENRNRKKDGGPGKLGRGHQSETESEDLFCPSDRSCAMRISSACPTMTSFQ